MLAWQLCGVEIEFGLGTFNRNQREGGGPVLTLARVHLEQKRGRVKRKRNQTERWLPLLPNEAGCQYLFHLQTLRNEAHQIRQETAVM